MNLNIKYCCNHFGPIIHYNIIIVLFIILYFISRSGLYVADLLLRIDIGPIIMDLRLWSSPNQNK